MKSLEVLSAAALALSVAAYALAQPIGERPAVENHMDQGAIELGLIELDAMRAHGNLVFDARFNFLDGQGRPASTGTGAPRVPDEPLFIRTSGPDSTSCFGCHAQPRSGGSGDFVANVFVLAQAADPVTTSVGPESGNERNTLGMMGSGAIEMLAREMTADLHKLREQARAEAVATRQPARRELMTKGVSFGAVTVLPDGRIDPSEIEGVDWDLIIKPFHQKGAVVSLREFTNNAMNHHHGIQTVERFGLDVDADGDGVANELSVGDVTAAAVFQACLNTPVQVMPAERIRRDAVMRGRGVFETIGCAECHIPELKLSDPVFTEPNPYNPPGNLHPSQVSALYAFDLTSDIEKPALPRAPGGGALVRAFTDLKRHDLNDADYDHFANELLPQGTINGFAPASDFTLAPSPRPTREFLTRKLWDVGNSAPYGHRGDLTTLTEAIYWHGGDARTSRDAFFALGRLDQDSLIEFLKAQQVVPPGGDDACPADCDGSGAIDIFDLLCYQNLFASGDPLADCDLSGSLDFMDFLCFRSAFDAGCP
ncbi:MAG: di-heme oxidoredictase family protein [Phycisphaerales bacterium JB039]